MPDLARDYFTSILDELRRLARIGQLVEELKSAEGVKAQSYDVIGSPGSSSDPTDRIDGRIDLEARYDTDLRALGMRVDLASIVLYGDDGRGGVAEAKGARYADPVCMRYLQGMGWREISDVMECTPRWCQELCSATFRWLDRHPDMMGKGQ